MALTQKQQSWATIIENWLSSGLTQAEYSQRNNIKLKILYWEKMGLSSDISASKKNVFAGVTASLKARLMCSSPQAALFYRHIQLACIRKRTSLFNR